MHKSSERFGIFFVSLAMAIWMAHAFIPHHHHETASYISGCSHHNENSEPQHCSISFHENGTDEHACFQCKVEHQWNSGTSCFQFSAALYTPVVYYYVTDSYKISYYTTTRKPWSSKHQYTHYRGPPSIA